MKLQFFSVDALEPDSDQDVIDDFCTRHRLVSVDKRFVERGDFCYWSVCVTYLEPSSSSSKPTKAVDKRGQVDYREILVAEDFAIYAKLRDLRKTISEENQLRYNGMLISVFELLADSRDQVNSVMAALNAEQQFWLADAALQASLIGKPTSAGVSGGGAAAAEAGAGH